MKKNNQKAQKNTQLYGLPPQNIEAEASLLSAILIDNRILDDIVDILIPKDFYRSAHQIIFRAMIELVEKREEKIPFEGKAELIVAKQRNGPTDSLSLAFLKSYSRFENLAFEEY
jgi:replicative DNA helicase